MATVLDPRFKTLYFKDVDSVITNLVDELMAFQEPIFFQEEDDVFLETPAAVEKPFFANRPIPSQVQRPPSTSSQEQIIRTTLQSYLMSPVITENADPLLWWRQNKDRFQQLAPLARKLLSIPPGSVDSERLFSVAGDIVTDKRTSLACEKAEQLIRSHYNLRILQFNY